MSVDSVTNPAPVESNSARKKRVKAEAEAAKISNNSPSASTPVEEQAEPLTNGDAALSPSDSPFIKELQKQIRNVNKKLNAMSKLDLILAENKDVPLNDLVASRKINSDQREQALRKPLLQSSLAQLEEQIANYKKIDSEYAARMASQHESLTSAHKSEIESLKAQLQKEAEEKSQVELRKKLLTFSQFLRAAAAKRFVEDEAGTEESRGFEGVLLLVYGGDEKAVDAAEKLIEGSDDTVPSTEGQQLSIKYSEIKAACDAYGRFLDEDLSNPEAVAEDQVAPAEPVEGAPISDPTITHAGLNELDEQPGDLPVIAEDEQGVSQASVDQAGANDAAQKQWDNHNPTSAGGAAEEGLDESFEMVSRNPEELESVPEPAQSGSTNSWADDVTAAAAQDSTPTAVPTLTNGDDGFHEVERRGGRGGHRGAGEARGRGGRGGRGPFRGEGRAEGRGGRGRGGFRGDGQRGRGRGGPRGGAPAPAPSS